ncbi:MAG: hypothetical protein ACFB2Z_03725 [Maricaulaceae bacterium]
MQQLLFDNQVRLKRFFLTLPAAIAVMYAGGVFWFNQKIPTYSSRIKGLTGHAVYLAAPQDLTELQIDARIMGTPPNYWQAISALSAVQSALTAYPESPLRQSGPALVLAGDVTLLGVEVGGTVQTPNVVILATRYMFGGLGTRDLKNTFHHEYSSILLREYVFPAEAWRDTLPDGFSFPETDSERLAATQVYADDLREYHQLGFVSDYGASSFENDVNTYAELLMGDPARLKQLSDQYAKIRAKKELILKFYVGINPDFVQRFRGAGLFDLSE